MFNVLQFPIPLKQPIRFLEILIIRQDKIDPRRFFKDGMGILVLAYWNQYYVSIWVRYKTLQITSQNPSWVNNVKFD